MTATTQWYVTLAELQHVTAAADQLHIAQPTLTRCSPAWNGDSGSRCSIAAASDSHSTPMDGPSTTMRVGPQGGAPFSPTAPSKTPPSSLSVRLTFGFPEFDRVEGHPVSDCEVHGSVTASGVHAAGGRCRIDQRPAESESVDVGVVSPRPKAPTLAWRSMFRQRLGVAVPHGHRLATVAAVSMTHLTSERFVTMHPGFGMRRLLDERRAQRNSSRGSSWSRLT